MTAATTRRPTAIVTRGFAEPGSRLAEALALRDYRLLLLDHRNRVAEDVAEFVGRAGHLDAAFIIAGPVDAIELPDSDPATYVDLVDANILDPLCALRAALLPMMAARSGDIVMIGPPVGVGASAFGAMSAATAWSFGALAGALRAEVEGQGIRVTFLQVDSRGGSGVAAASVVRAALLAIDQSRDASLSEITLRAAAQPCD
jgi:NAD(P)-dependent dehydrogenase (short-subunit alcohol dehydrogenase family)